MAQVGEAADWGTGIISAEKVIDFTRYDLPANEPADPAPGNNSRNWSLINRLNQKGARPRDKPVVIDELTAEDRALIRLQYPDLVKAVGEDPR